MNVLGIFARFLTLERCLALLTLDVIRSKGNRNANINAKRSDTKIEVEDFGIKFKVLRKVKRHCIA